MAEQRIEVEFGAKIRDLLSGLSTARSATKDTVDGMKGHLSGLTTFADGLKAPFIAITSILAGGAIFGNAIADAADLGEHLQVLSQKTGMEAVELSRLEYAAKLSDIRVETLGGGLTKLARAMQEVQTGEGTAGEALARIGVKATDADGKLRPMRDVLLDVSTKMAGMKDGAGKTALAIDLFGKSGADLIPFLNQGAQGISDLEAEAGRLGITMSNEAAQAAADYGDAMDRLHGMIGGVARSLVVSMMPALTDVSNALTAFGGASSVAEKGGSLLAKGIRFVALGALEGYAAVNAFVQVVKVINTMMSTPIGRGWSASVSKAGDDAYMAIERVNAKVAASIAILKQGSAPGATSPGRGGGEDPDAPPKTKKTKKTEGADERLAAWKDELAQTQAAEEAGKDTLLVDEISFWQAKLRTIQGNGKADVKLRQQINAEILGADKQLHADELRSAEIRAQAKRDAALEELEIERRSIEDRRNARELDAQQAEAQLLALNARMLEIRIADLERQRELAAGDMVKTAEIDAQIAAAKRAAGREIVQIHKETTGAIAGEWDQVLGRVEQGLERTINGLITGTQSLRQGLKGIFQGMTIDFLTQKSAELRHHVAVELAKRGITTSTVAHKIITEGAGAVKSIAITVATGLKQIVVYAATAAAGAYAALAAIPLIGPILAPVAAGVALAGVLALGGKIASAEGGYDIPSNVNPLTQLHKREMVLPAPLADAVRGMASGRGPAAGTGATTPGGSATAVATAASMASAIAAAVEKAAMSAAAASPPQTHQHDYHIHAIDSRSLEETLRRNPAAFAAGAKAAARNGHGARG